jgi:hypothetical protein
MKNTPELTFEDEAFIDSIDGMFRRLGIPI